MSTFRPISAAPATGASRILSALSLALLVVGCAPDTEGVAPPVILITLDTVRADHLGCYGYSLPTSPQIDAFAAKATRFERAKATAPWTLPSHASLFTGQYPFEHAAHTIWVDPADSALTDNVRPLSTEAVTLAERFAEAGYETAAFAANTVYLHERYGLGQGFETYHVEHGYAPAINASAAAWLDGRDAERPFFLFLNYMDAHSPYNTAPRPGWGEGSANSRPLIERMRTLVLPGEGPLPKRGLDRMRQQYDLAIANLDEGLGTLFDMLRERNLFDPSLIIVASDHGECFGEHRLVAHSKDVFEPMIAVPLIVKAPGQRVGETESRLVSLAQVPALMQPHCPALFQAEFSTPWPTPSVYSENHFARLKDLRRPWADRFQRSRLAIYEGDEKLIKSSDGDPELYDLVTDAPETRNLAGNLPERVRVLLEKLEEQVNLHGARAQKMDPRSLSPAEIEQLKALGYF